MRPHILIVEDDPATRESLSLMLNSEGYVVDEAADGSTALACSRSRLPPRLVILDLQMPGMDGWQFLAARHREAALATVPVLVLTAIRGIDVPRLRTLGVQGVFEKPAAAEDMVTAVRRYCPAAGPPALGRNSPGGGVRHGYEDHPLLRLPIARRSVLPPRAERLVLLGRVCLALGFLTVVFGFPGVVGLPLGLAAMRICARRLREARQGPRGLAGKVAIQRAARAARLGAAVSFGGLVGWGMAALLYFLT